MQTLKEGRLREKNKQNGEMNNSNSFQTERENLNQLILQNGDSIEKKRKKIQYWSREEEQCLIEFWIKKFINFPLRSYTVHRPLKRCSHFREMKGFIYEKIGRIRSKHQCKSKYQTIKHKIKADVDIVKKKRPSSFDFKDYIIQKGSEMASGNQSIQALLDKFMILLERQSEFMVQTENQLKFEQSTQTKQIVSDIIKYQNQQETRN